MRFDEASAKYADFGDFYVGQLIEPEAWAEQAIAR
jgi:chlorite dismutase